MQQDVQEKVNRAAKDIMVMARNTVTIDLRCMYSAVTALRLKAAQMGFAVDGRYVYYEPLQVLTESKEEKNRPAHAYLHMMLHAIFRHFYVNTLLNQEYWTLACDIAVEAIIIELDLRDTKLDVNEERRREIQKLRKRVKLLTAEKLYHLFLNEEPPQAEVDRLL